MTQTNDQKMSGIDDLIQGPGSKSEIRSSANRADRINNVAKRFTYCDKDGIQHVVAEVLSPTDSVPTTLAGMTALGYDNFGIGSQVRFSGGKLAIKTAAEGVAGWAVLTGTALA